MNTQSRRSFISRCALATAGITVGGFVQAAPATMRKPFGDQEATVCAFSKMFDFLGQDMFPFLADAGFQGIDLTVRPGGFVRPENAEKELPAAVRNAQKNGLSVPMIATGITDGTDPLAAKVLKTAADLGIRYYRTGYYYYNDRLSMVQNLEQIRKSFLGLSELNARYGLQASYQNHVGGAFGGSVWDLWYIVRDFDPRYVGCQYDIRHAVAEGLSSWKSGLKAISTHVGNLCIKDFIFESRNGKWGVRSVPLGTGAVDFNAFFDIVRTHHINGPMSVHYEFSLIDSRDESLPVKEKMKKMLPVVHKEVDTLSGFIKNDKTI